MSIPESVLQRITDLDARQRELDFVITKEEQEIAACHVRLQNARREMAVNSERLQDIRDVCEAFMNTGPNIDLDTELDEDWGAVEPLSREALRSQPEKPQSKVRSNKAVVLDILRRADRPMLATEVRNILGSQASQYLTRLKHENLVVHEGNLWSAA